MNLSIKSLLIVFFILFFAEQACTAQPPVLENENLRIVVDTSGGIRLKSFFSKLQSRDLLNLDRYIPLYQIELYRETKPTVITPDQADEVFFSFSGPQTLNIIAKHSSLNLEVICHINLPQGSKTASFSIEVRRQNNYYKVGIIRFPGYALNLTKKSSNILLPVADGQLITDPLVNMGDGENRGFDYPGSASAQLMAYYDGKGGVVSYAADGEGNYKRLNVRRYGTGLLLLFEHITYHLGDLHLKVPYSVEVGAFEGSWERAADVYKKWAVNQKWCRTRLEDRSIPANVRQPAFFLGINIREMAGEGRSINRSGDIPDFVNEWQKKLDLPVNTILLSWEKNGPWVAPDYFPPYGGEASFTGIIQKLHQQGNFSSLYLSGLNYTLEKTPRHGAGYFKTGRSEEKIAEKSAIIDFNGKLHVEGTAAEGTGKRLVICPSTQLAFDILGNAVHKSLEYGVDLIQIDQIVGGGSPPCFSAEHNHPPGGGTTVYRSISRLLDTFTAAARKRNPPAAISLEEPNELYIPHVDIFHTREYMQRFWPRERKGSLGIPLFSYLYHEYSLGYGGDSAPLVTAEESPTVALYAQAMNLITGKMPAGAAWMKMVPFTDLHPDVQEFMRNCATLLKSEAGKYIITGKILYLENQEIGGQTIGFNIGPKYYEFQAPNLLARGFQLKTGSMGLLYINLTGSALKAKLDFSSVKLQGKAIRKWPSEEKVFESGDEYTFPPHGILFLKVK